MRTRQLTDQTEVSTIIISLREEKNFVPEGPPTVATRLLRALFGSLATMRGTGIDTLVLIAALLPQLVRVGDQTKEAIGGIQTVGKSITRSFAM